MNKDQIDIDEWLDEHYDDETEALGVDNDDSGDYNDESEGVDNEG